MALPSAAQLIFEAARHSLNTLDAQTCTKPAAIDVLNEMSQRLAKCPLLLNRKPPEVAQENSQ
jgi:hypothetical protein